MSPRAKSPRALSPGFAEANAAAKYILRRTRLRPRVAVVLGSGLGGFASALAHASRIAYDKIPHFSAPTAIGHAGRFVIGTLDAVPVGVLEGRVHLYEGYSPAEVIFPMRVLARLGVRSVILTNAAGGISLDYRAGALVLLRDHINLMGVNPLAGPNDQRFGVRFPDLTRVYWPAYREFAWEEARKLGLEIFEGVYAGVSGPSYETPAEIRALRAMGTDLVGMSTVPEAIAAAHLGVRVLGISCVTNMAAGILDQPITSEEVIATGERSASDLAALVRAVIPRISSDPGSR